MTVVIDGALFSLDAPHATPAWAGILSRLGADSGMRIVLLDRGGAPSDFDGVEVVPFPSYNAKFGAADSVLLEQICRHFAADAFVSTHVTTPLETPSVKVVDDEVITRLTTGVEDPEGRENSIAIAHARRFVCTSHSVRAELLNFFPELAEEPLPVAGPGVGLAETLVDELRLCIADSASGRYDDFTRHWKDLRQFQASVDVPDP